MVTWRPGVFSTTRFYNTVTILSSPGGLHNLASRFLFGLWRELGFVSFLFGPLLLRGRVKSGPVFMAPTLVLDRPRKGKNNRRTRTWNIRTYSVSDRGNMPKITACSVMWETIVLPPLGSLKNCLEKLLVHISRCLAPEKQLSLFCRTLSFLVFNFVLFHHCCHLTRSSQRGRNRQRDGSPRGYDQSS